MKTYTVILDTKFVGRHKTEIKAKDIEEAKKKALKAFENEYNEVKAIIEK